jgi:hypothetical protein
MVSVGGVNLAEALVNSELRIMVLERLVEQLLENQARMGHKPDVDMTAIRKAAIKKLQAKYPDLTIKSDGAE